MKKWNWKKIVLGIAIILGIIASILMAVFDGDPETKPDVKQAVEGIKEGTDLIKEGINEGKEPSEAVKPESDDSSFYNYNQRNFYELADKIYQGHYRHFCERVQFKTCGA